MSCTSSRIARVGIGVALGALIAAGPWAVSSGLHAGAPLALAHGGGGGGNGGGGGHGGGGAGNGGGQGGGHAGGAGVGSSQSGDHAASATSGAGGVGTAAGNPDGRGPGAATSGELASALGALNAAHANPEALASASPNSEVGKLAAYDQAMLAALAMPAVTPAEIAAQNEAIADARSTELVAAANKPLSPSIVAQVDGLLGLPPSDPALGVAP